MLLRRRIVRALGDGASIVVDREWMIGFSRQGTGSIVSGRQLSAKVEAPAALAAFAELEKGRSTDGMFPVLLTGSGSVLGAGDYVSASDLDRAAGEAERMIATATSSTALKSARLSGLVPMQKANNTFTDQIPQDLFYPRASKSVTVHPVALNDSMSGEFELHYEASCAADGPWLAKAERRIVTRIGESERQTSDLWTMTQA